MQLDERIKDAADRFWLELSARSSLAPYRGADMQSPDNVLAIERLFEHRDSHGVAGLVETLTAEQQERSIFNLGAYVGEIVRHFHGEKCRWVEGSGDEGIELHLPGDKPPLFPMRIAGEQIREYRAGSLVKWARGAGLIVHDRRDLPRASFQPKIRG